MVEKNIIEDRDELCELAPVARASIRRHVLVCSGTSCTAAGSAEVKEAFARELKARGLLFGRASKGGNPEGSVVLTDCSSVGFCAIGAAVLVYPDGVWYAQVRARDVAEIVEEHVVAGRVVERLALLKIPPAGGREGGAGGLPGNAAAAELDKTKADAGS
jgi:(2Fe-2S) ferredoxin